MLMEESVISHLAQLYLKGDDEAILIGLKEWLSTTQFEERGDEWELCTDSELPEKWKLLKKMDLAQKVQRLAVEIKESANTCLVHRTRILEYSITRVPGPRPSRFKNTGGPFYVTPIQILSGSPTVEELPLSTKRTTYVHKNKTVKIAPALYILFILTDACLNAEKDILMVRLAFICVGSSVPAVDVPEYWTIQRRILSHVRQCSTNLCDGINFGSQNDDKILNAMNSLGNLYAAQANMNEAEKMYLRALTGYEKALGPDHTSSLDIVKNIGTLYKRQGKMNDVEKMHLRDLGSRP